MKYLLTILLFLSANVFTLDRYVVCDDIKIYVVSKCVNDFLDSGYKTLSGLHAVQEERYTRFFQALIKEWKQINPSKETAE